MEGIVAHLQRRDKRRLQKKVRKCRGGRLRTRGTCMGRRG